MRGSFSIVGYSILLTALGAPGCALDADESPAREGRAEAVAQALPAPIPGVDITAQRAFVGDPLRGMGPGQPGNLYALNADDGAAMASTTKSFTLLLAVEAVAKGVVKLNDVVTISTKAANIDNNHQGGGHSEAGFPAGEQVRFEDLLYAMMIPSGGDASIAIAQHIAVKTFPFLQWASDAAQEAAFVGMMNTRAAQLGLTDTEFFNPYGGDHAHAADNTPGGVVPHRASTRDMARWFDFGMKNALFRTVAGFQGTYSFNAIDGTPYSYGQTFGYPGMRGQKGGSNTGCNTCLVGSARRIGRDLLVAYTQSEGGDGTPLLDFGFAELFHPAPKAISPEWKGAWTKTALACVTEQRAASVVVRPNGTMQILVWGVDVGDGSIQHLNPLASLVVTIGDVSRDTGDTGDTGGIDYGGPRDTGGSRGITYGGPKPLITDARIEYAGNGNLVVVAETNLGVYLYSYGITSEDKIVQRDIELVGAGSDARVQVLHPTLIVTAHRDAGGTATLKTWRLDALTGKLANPLDTYAGLGVSADEIELAGRPGSTSNLHLVLAFKSAGGQRAVRSFDVVRATGAITPEAIVNFPSGGSRLALTNVPGFGASRDVYALAYRDGAGRLAIESYEYAPNGSITRLSQSIDTDNAAMSASAPIRISAYREGGVFVATQPNPNVSQERLDVWALDPSGTSTAIVPNRVTSRSVIENGLHGVCRVPTNAAEGDFLMATGKPGVEGIRLRAFRSGPRQ